MGGGAGRPGPPHLDRRPDGQRPAVPPLGGAAGHRARGPADRADHGDGRGDRPRGGPERLGRDGAAPRAGAVLLPDGRADERGRRRPGRGGRVAREPMGLAGDCAEAEACRGAWPDGGPGLGTAAAIGLAAITPFDIRPDERSVKEAIKRARLVPFGPAVRGPAPPGDAWSWTAEALAWSLAGGVAALALRESGRGAGRSVAGGAALVAALAAACEMAQVFVASRRVDATSVVLAAAGGFAGAAAAVLGRRRSRPPGPARPWSPGRSSWP